MSLKWLKGFDLHFESLDPDAHKNSRHFLILWSLSFFLNYSESWRQPTLTFGLLIICLLALVVKNLKLVWWVYLISSTSVLLYKFPILANHSIFNLFVNVFLFFILMKNKLLRFEARYASSAVLGLAVVYFWAAFHKVNSDFLFLEESCAYSFMKRIDKTYFDGILPSSITRFSFLPILIVIYEFLIAFFLLFKRSFFGGFFLSLVFHLSLAPLEFIDFSMISISLYTLYLSSFANKEWRKSIFRVIPYFVLSQLVLGVALFFIENKGKNSVFYQTQCVFLFFFIGYFLYHSFKYLKGFRYGSIWKLKKSLYIFPALIFLFGSFNYLGLSTAGTFSMFSNLRTEGTSWNHLLVPRSVRVFDYQNDIYWTLSAPKNLLRVNREHPRLNYGTPEIEFHRVLAFWKKEGIDPGGFVYEINDEKKELDKGELEVFLRNKNYGVLEKKLLYFRRIQPYYEANECRW